MTNDDTDPSVDRERAAVSNTDLELGSVVYSNSHMDYVVEAYRERDRETSPEKQDYQFGQPVYIRETIDGTEYAIIGVIYNTLLVDPDQGRVGPRLSADRQEMFNPGYVEDKQTLLGVALLGYATLTSSREGEWKFGDVSHDMPPWALDIDGLVLKLSSEGVRQFHTADGAPHLGYYQRLVEVAGDFGAEVTLALIECLRRGSDLDPAILKVIERNIRWQATTDRGVTR